MSFIEFDKVYRRYQTGEVSIPAVDGVSFQIEKGEFCCIVGTSGSGKSTLLNILAGLEQSSKGNVFINEKNICSMTEKELSLFRQERLN